MIMFNNFLIGIRVAIDVAFAERLSITLSHYHNNVVIMMILSR